MAKWLHYYLIRIEFLGFRYHGWAKQGTLKTVHHMVDRTINYVLDHDQFKTLGCGRTDALVSAMDYAFELFTNEEIDQTRFLKKFNENLPADIRAKSIKSVNEQFNVIQASRTKEYHYSFTFGNKEHPFSAPFMTQFHEKLNIDAMMEAAVIYRGTHNFRRFVSKPSDQAILERHISHSRIVPNTDHESTHFPESSFIFQVASSGFLRYQVRLMMGALREVGQGKLTIEDLREALENPDGEPFTRKAPATGLMLYEVNFEEE